MTTIPACDVLPGMVIRTAFDPGLFPKATAVAAFRVTYVDEFDGAVCIHADSRSSRIFEIPNHVQVQVLQWPPYAQEAVVTAPEVMDSWRADQEYLTPEQVREFARQKSKGQHPSNGAGVTCIPADVAQAYIGELKEALNTYCQPIGKNKAAS